MRNAGLLLLGPVGLLFAALLCAHAVGDFVLQTDRMARAKRERFMVLATHVAIVTALHVILVLPLIPLRALPVVIVLGLAHLGLDTLKTALDRRWTRPLAHFALDQGLHLATLVVAWAWLTRLMLRWGATCPTIVQDRDLVALLTRAALLVAGFAFVGKGGAAIVRGVLARFPDIVAKAGGTLERGASRGETIGILERVLGLTLVLAAQWSALGLVFGAKSIARFKELEDRAFTEYYLIGTLASVLVAVFTGLVLRLLGVVG